MSGRWFRLYDELVDDPKVQMLPDRLFRALINLWCLTCRNDGALPPLPEIAFSLRMPEAKVAAILAELREVGLIDEDDDGNSTPHNWGGRQFRSDVSTDRVKRHRQRRRNVSSAVPRNGNGTPPDTETDTEGKNPSLRSGQKAKPTPASRGSRLPDDFEPDPGVGLAEGLGLPATMREVAKFCDYWRSAPGQRGVKADWPATWRNWCRKAAEDRKHGPNPGSTTNSGNTGKRPAAGAHDALLGAVARRFAPVPADGRPGQADAPGEPPAGPAEDDPGPRLDLGPDAFRRH